MTSPFGPDEEDADAREVLEDVGEDEPAQPPGDVGGGGEAPAAP